MEPAATLEPATTKAPTRFPPGTITNQADRRLEFVRNIWDGMMEKSNMNIRVKKQNRIHYKFNKLCDQFKARHDKLEEAGCTFKMDSQLLIGMPFIDFSDTCRTTNKIIRGTVYLIVI